ncbi:unnamed protein product [Didymodactylos carnosus]|uniref:Uncharacterized protein n=1 Tax=Didymodactylos carnosus TaxID=1234261 RepID=A0A815EBI5_9BILA|nr:unnamed protein product [Didymodactylos carnosus]CAF1309389.1 unnamed protein product [Didymodactylos carnosus]CAF4012726.1 unnamed protein product [Didymodactylos carnosus]CAF4145458.1 unnamed protein product [Didymodactylos carnosus]
MGNVPSHMIPCLTIQHLVMTLTSIKLTLIILKNMPNLLRLNVQIGYNYGFTEAQSWNISESHILKHLEIHLKNITCDSEFIVYSTQYLEQLEYLTLIIDHTAEKDLEYFDENNGKMYAQQD